MESKDKRLEYLKEYNKEKRIRISLNLSKEYEADIIEAIEREGKGNKQAGVKRLIRKGIEYNGDRYRPLPC